ncbi:uncharacterized protein [Magallana gigas]|uniref:uncharacterized protein isoform X2 n=1 Tax=Magallana gigas TaxID=29159 RepID=UPI00333EA2CB
MLQYAVKGEYTNFRGAWLNDTHFLVAKRFFTDRTHFKLEAHEVKLTSKNKKINLKKLFKKCKIKGKGVLVTHSFPSRNDFIRVIDPRKWGDLRQYHPNLDQVEMEPLGNDNSQPGGGQRKQQQGKPDTDSSDRESEDEQLDGENSKRDDHQVDEDSSDEDDLSDEDELNESDIESAMREPMLYYKMVRSTWFKKNRWQQTRKHVPPMKDESSRPYPQVLMQIQSQGGKIVTMVRDSDCGEKFEIVFFSIKDDEEVCAAPFKVLKMDAKIIGLRVSHDQRYLVYSCRNQIEDDEDDSGDDSDDVDGSDDDSDDDDDWTFQSDILTVVYDLILDQCLENVYLRCNARFTNHLGVFFPDLSQDFVATGDEFIEGHLWDRHYGVKLETSILHRNCGQQSSGLNAVAFHPYDQETLVTAGDDRLLKVWRSKNRQAQIARGEYLGETLGLGLMDDFGRDLAEGDERTCGRISPTFNLLFDVKKKSTKK